jgi:hypothetical protein
VVGVSPGPIQALLGGTTGWRDRTRRAGGERPVKVVVRQRRSAGYAVDRLLTSGIETGKDGSAAIESLARK